MTRAATAAAVVAAAALVALVLFDGGGSYTVRAHFHNAGQVVEGGSVVIGGRQAGQVVSMELTDDGQAELELRIDDEHAPLPAGTRATIRRVGLSGPASRYVDLELPAERRGEIDDGGEIGIERTRSLVDLDQFFRIFNRPTRRALRGVLRGSERQWADGDEGAGRDAAAGWLYLDPALVASTRLFEELTRDTPALERFLVETSELVGDVAARREELAGLVDHLADVTNAISRPRGALADAIRQLPPFMRRANTTYVNLRATLDDLDPLVEDARPVARRLRPYAAELRGLADELGPTLRDFGALIRRRGAANDLVDLGRLTLPLRDAGVGPVEAHGARRPGALPATADALRSAIPRFGFYRPYVVDLLGWFDDYSHSGLTDALGGFARTATHVNAFALKNGTFTPLSPSVRGSALRELASIGQNNRCPGSMERSFDGSNPWRPTPDFNCDPTMVLPGR